MISLAQDYLGILIISLADGWAIPCISSLWGVSSSCSKKSPSDPFRWLFHLTLALFLATFVPPLIWDTFHGTYRAELTADATAYMKSFPLPVTTDIPWHSLSKFVLDIISPCQKVCCCICTWLSRFNWCMHFFPHELFFLICFGSSEWMAGKLSIWWWGCLKEFVIY